MANFIVGDIQGCYSGLTRLLDKAGFVAGRDTLWAVGDLVARGPDSLKTLSFLYGLGDSFHCVLGNHDLHFLAVSQGLKPVKKSDNLEALLGAKALPRYIDWLRQFPLAARPDKRHLVAHAGLYPSWSFADALSLSNEIHELLRGPHWITLLSDMYGNDPDSWSPELTHSARFRFIINAFTRMRFLDSKERLEFACKSTPAQAPEDLHPWFTVANPNLKSSQRVVFGHWAALMGETASKQFIGLDTGYVWGNQMTLYHLESRETIQVG